MEYICCRSDRIRTQVEAQASLLGSCNEAVGRSLVTRDVHIASRNFVLGFYTIDVDGAGMGVVTIVPTSLNHFDVCLGDCWLLGELLFQEVCHEVQVAVEEPADQTQCEHVTALHHRLVVHA